MRDILIINKFKKTSFALACSLAAVLLASSGCAKKLEQGDPGPVLALLRCAGTCSAATVNTDFSAPVKVTISGYTGAHAMEPFITRDGNYLFFNSLNDGIDTSLYYAAKGADDVTFDFVDEIGNVNGGPGNHLDAVASMDTGGNFYFISTRGWPVEIRNVYTGAFSGGTVTGPYNLDGDFYINQTGWIIMDGEISPDGQTYYFVNAHFSGGAVPDRSDIGIAEYDVSGAFNRIADNDAIMAAVNTGRCLEYAPSISEDGLELYFTRLDLCSVSSEILVSKRASDTDPFGEPARIAAIAGFVEAPSLSGDGKTLYYHMNDGGTYAIYKVSRP